MTTGNVCFADKIRTALPLVAVPLTPSAGLTAVMAVNIPPSPIAASAILRLLTFIKVLLSPFSTTARWHVIRTLSSGAIARARGREKGPLMCIVSELDETVIN